MPFDHFDWLAPLYDRAIHEFSAQESLQRYLDLPAAGRLLDAGGGTGRVAAALHGQASQIIIADLSRGMLRQAALKPGLWPVCSHTEHLPFPDAFFDRVIMVDALHHVIDQTSTARELWRVLKTGGRIVIQEPDVRRFSVKLIALAEKLALMRSHFLLPPNIADLFPMDGARIEHYTEDYSAWVVILK